LALRVGKRNEGVVELNVLKVCKFSGMIRDRIFLSESFQELI
jgi:hypothetical protein